MRHSALLSKLILPLSCLADGIPPALDTFQSPLLGPEASVAYRANSTVYILEDVQSEIAQYQHQQQLTGASTAVECDLACAFLSSVLPDNLAYPDTPVYQSQQQYWSAQQANVQPKCRFSPKTAADVSLAVLTLRATSCKFAVKSGGHAAFVGASNAQDGVTIDLVHLNEITLSADKKQASIGPGNLWEAVYKELSPQNLTVIGGRVGDVGVGGYMLGGGISFFSSRYGWACDNVNNYEVVFADGSVNNVNSTHHPDLYFALRGGGNNFGIVTRYDLATISQGELWAGMQVHVFNQQAAAAVNSAFYWLAINSPQDVDAQAIVSYAYLEAFGAYIIASEIQYAKPTPYPPILKNFTDIPSAISNTVQNRDLSHLIAASQAVDSIGFRHTYRTFTVGNNVELMNEMAAIHSEEKESVKRVGGITAAITFQPITATQTRHMSKNGGNALGLAGQGPLNRKTWTDKADDEVILATARRIVARCVAAAKEHGLSHRFQYQNYASQSQDVFAGYGPENHKRLKFISEKYDPEQVWGALQPGYFKV